MNSKPNHFKIGVFILSGLTLFLVTLLGLGARSYLEKKTTYETYIPGNVEGLSLGAPVKLRGVPVGKVTRIGFTWNQYRQSREGYVLVEFEVKESSSLLAPCDDPKSELKGEIKKGLRVRVRGQGITGLSILSLEYLPPQENAVPPISWEPRNAYIPSAPGQFDEMLASIERSLKKIEELDFKAINDGLTGSLGTVKILLEQSKELNLGGITSNANQLVAELRVTNGKLQNLMTNVDTSINTMELGKLSSNTSQMIAEITRVSERLTQVLDTFDTGSVNETVVNARIATENLNEALQDLKKCPSSFIFGKQPPPAKSVTSGSR